MHVTIFQNISNTDAPFHVPVSKSLERIKKGTSKELIQKIRKESDKSERQKLKKKLPAVLFSGKFSKRLDSHLVEHSGLICLDFDGYKSAKAMNEEKARLRASDYVYSVFVSPSGNGLKVLVKIPKDADNHKLYFNALKEHFNSEHFDVTSKNISRVCYESYDPMIYVNENSHVWEDMAEPEYREYNRGQGEVTIPITDENKIVEILVKWWTDKYPMIEGQRNQNAFILAAAFNDFGVNKALASHVLMSYESSDFDRREIQQSIDSAYSKTEKFGTKVYEDEDRMNHLRARSRRGMSHDQIKEDLKESGMDDDDAEVIASRVEEDSKISVFWTVSQKGVVKINHLGFKEFLEDNGFFKYCPPGSQSYVFVQVVNNLIVQTTEKDIKDFVLKHLEENSVLGVYNYFAENTKYFKDNFLDLLDTINVYFIDDTKTESYLYYRNCAVKITKDNIETIDYVDLGGYVWKDHIIDRNFKVSKTKKCDFNTFIKNICGNNTDRVKSMESTIGFLMHGHKDRSFCPAVILNDEVISDNPEGGTGKGLLMTAIGHMKKLVVIDGKSFSFDRSFAYQTVSVDTQVLCFDDIRKNFNFERLFSVITEGVTIEKKNKDAVKVPFDKSAKIAITTNYAVRGSGNSFARRKWDLELKQYYSKSFTPMDEFGKLMFDGWSEDEWRIFDNYMIGCLQTYLAHGLVESDFDNLPIRQLTAETTYDFVEWAGLIDGVENDKLAPYVTNLKQDLFFAFINDYPDYQPRSKMTISQKTFYRWLNAYAIHQYGVFPKEGRNAQGRTITFVEKEDLNPIDKQSKLEL